MVMAKTTRIPFLVAGPSGWEDAFFRPPPPLSNAVQDRIYTQLQQGDKDVATLASEYCISKARIHAIHKLKQVEAEFRRQSLPLQEAFQYGMEPLLDMKSPIDPSTRQYSERSAREEARARASDVSHQTEIVEETRWENGQGAEGSFGEPIQGLDNRRVEGLAWEWRDEETMGEIQPDRFTLPKRAQRERRDTSVVAPAQLLPAQGSKSAIRFIDMSKVGIPQEVQVARRLQSRAHQTSKRKARRDDVRRRASSPAPKSE
ncbi:hypothetical protein BD324DRAFT_497994 [Kockovaella imperatae]|uniref:Eukaryotic mitochondrial regulator protein-domain-containing protein n=1 Tax=Kockovaella imperatae TaxID=4999 RepID=A0A1Y1UEN8_9TREE|nr:hypothetical protein BD324DRAFT_497994 [Kockovaella imperatae]ORX36449.1 hypothetical protein BD324DRAFT_497994 [Kockovaella imperatae]